MRRAAAATGAVGVTLALAACGGGGEKAVDAAPADQASNPLCTKVSQHWPATVSSEKQRKVTTDSPTVRAWGDPAIIARCGVTSPGPTTDKCVSADNIDWVATPLSDGTRYVTYGRSPAIELLVPTKYGGWPLAAFSGAASQIPQGSHHCS
ncbi:DUF3515 domain-containing protein [Flexivirga sp. ID2601S]|uniref:DUF3515 domain-containing protein n=1 Tax=Flexivirga aerilata TaxID=1656889 RepID=A0A849ALS5_9MICO|nr:DUF3515 domain-containing protein [Flexivirga aerilata]NNG40311.1 DUF3515 domain-containing protein [Flexivirga aerilata]